MYSEIIYICSFVSVLKKETCSCTHGFVKKNFKYQERARRIPDPKGSQLPRLPKIE